MRTLNKSIAGVILGLFRHTSPFLPLCQGYTSFYSPWLTNRHPSFRNARRAAATTSTVTTEVESVVPPTTQIGGDATRRSDTARVNLDVEAAGAPPSVRADDSWSDPCLRLSIDSSPMTSPRQWLEAQPDGAYTVLRCDYLVDVDRNRFVVDRDGASVPTATNASVRQWKVWGLNFHMDRLRESYGLFDQLEQEQRTADAASEELATDLQRAMNVTLAMIQLQLSSNGLLALNVSAGDAPVSVPEVVTFMLTVLWTPCRRQADRALPCFVRSNSAIAVTTHMTIVSSSPKNDFLASGMPAPIRAVLALSFDRAMSIGMQVTNAVGAVKGGRTPDMLPETRLTSLPSRFPFPQAKLSAWCRNRRPLEEMFMRGGGNTKSSVGEVILCNVASGSQVTRTELLEGLTTNLFVLYKDGTLRTAPCPHVLDGYARNWILQRLHAHNRSSQFRKVVRVVEQAPLLEERHQWDEVFVTSSIRLVVPVQSVCVRRTEGDDDDVTVWESSPRDAETGRDDDGTTRSDARSLAQELYHALLQSIFE